MPEIDAVVIMASWESHLNLACDAMRAGKYTAVEVAGAYSVEDCWKLVRTHEETGVPCMMLENCCYCRNELMVLNMVRRGLFGEVVHCQGGYRHDLREEVSTGRGCGTTASATTCTGTAKTTPPTSWAPLQTCWTSTAATAC